MWPGMKLRRCNKVSQKSMENLEIFRELKGENLATKGYQEHQIPMDSRVEKNIPKQSETEVNQEVRTAACNHPHAKGRN